MCVGERKREKERVDKREGKREEETQYKNVCTFFVSNFEIGSHHCMARITNYLDQNENSVSARDK